MALQSPKLYNALIRIHHVASRKKIAKVKDAANANACFVLVRSGSPGVMYVEGQEGDVRKWVDIVHSLRYKDYQLLCRPAELALSEEHGRPIGSTGLSEVETMKDFGAQMQQRGIWSWWRQAMGYTSPPEKS